MKYKIFCLILAVSLIVFSFPASATSAKSSVVINADTGTVLFSENPEEKLPMASTTKIMTSLVLLEKCDLEKVITVKREMVMVEGSAMGLRAGDKVSYYALLVGMLLSSGNDAANTVALSISGSAKKFSKLMNKKAKEIGMRNTHFVTPSGLDDENHYSTCYDMAILAMTAMKNKTFCDVVSSKTLTVKFGNPMQNYTLSNHNRLLKILPCACGVKTGFTKKSGRCLVSAAKENGKKVIAVTLNDGDDWDDHVELLTNGLAALNEYSLSSAAKSTKIKVIGGAQKCVGISYKEKIIGLTEDEFKNIEFSYRLQKELNAPISSDTAVGCVSVKLGRREIGCFKAYPMKNIKAKPQKPQKSYFKRFMSLI